MEQKFVSVTLGRLNNDLSIEAELLNTFLRITKTYSKFRTALYIAIGRIEMPDSQVRFTKGDAQTANWLFGPAAQIATSLDFLIKEQDLERVRISEKGVVMRENQSPALLT